MIGFQACGQIENFNIANEKQIFKPKKMSQA